jgi:hypothetical protein
MGAKLFQGAAADRRKMRWGTVYFLAREKLTYQKLIPRGKK